MTENSFPVDVLIKDGAWVDHIPDPEAFCVQIVNVVTTLKDNYKPGEISIALVCDDEIQNLNKIYRHKDKPTNVLSFPDNGPAPLLGDIVVSRETVVREARNAGKSAADHLAHMLVHGFLHLQGYDHENDQEANVMESLEIKALGVLNIDNPYKIKELQDK